MTRLRTLVALCLFATACHNTAQGIKEDTKHAIDKTDDALHRAAKKIDSKLGGQKDGG
jgi:predicted small secreted protein